MAGRGGWERRVQGTVSNPSKLPVGGIVQGIRNLESEVRGLPTGVGECRLTQGIHNLESEVRGWRGAHTTGVGESRLAQGIHNLEQGIHNPKQHTSRDGVVTDAVLVDLESLFREYQTLKDCEGNPFQRKPFQLRRTVEQIVEFVYKRIPLTRVDVYHNIIKTLIHNREYKYLDPDMDLGGVPPDLQRFTASNDSLPRHARWFQVLAEEVYDAEQRNSATAPLTRETFVTQHDPARVAQVVDCTGLLVELSKLVLSYATIHVLRYCPNVTLTKFPRRPTKCFHCRQGYDAPRLDPPMPFTTQPTRVLEVTNPVQLVHILDQDFSGLMHVYHEEFEVKDFKKTIQRYCDDVKTQDLLGTIMGGYCDDVKTQDLLGTIMGVKPRPCQYLPNALIVHSQVAKAAIDFRQFFVYNMLSHGWETDLATHGGTYTFKFVHSQVIDYNNVGRGDHANFSLHIFSHSLHRKPYKQRMCGLPDCDVFDLDY